MIIYIYIYKKLIKSLKRNNFIIHIKESTNLKKKIYQISKSL